MDLFIQIVNGQPFGHPILGDNFRLAFPNIDTNNLPPEFARFVRLPAPNINQLQVLEGSTYQWVDGVVQDVWIVREMNEAERAEKIQLLTNFANEMHQGTIVMVQNSIANETNPTALQAWNSWLDALNAWTLTDPVNPAVPGAPEALKQYLLSLKPAPQG